jgi:hypothetical protein
MPDAALECQAQCEFGSLRVRVSAWFELARVTFCSLELPGRQRHVASSLIELENLSTQLAGCHVLPRSKVLKREPSAATMSATSALAADTPTRSALVGDFIRCHRVPSVVSNTVP